MPVENGRVFIGRFRRKEDLLLSLTALCKKENIRLGQFSVIGALKKLKLGYYDQNRQEYVKCVDLEDKLEVTSCIGNVSLKDNEIFVHAHITVADLSGRCYGGHLIEGSEIFAAEYVVSEIIGAEMVRGFDEETGLSLWKI